MQNRGAKGNIGVVLPGDARRPCLTGTGALSPAVWLLLSIGRKGHKGCSLPQAKYTCDLLQFPLCFQDSLVSSSSRFHHSVFRCQRSRAIPPFNPSMGLDSHYLLQQREDTTEIRSWYPSGIFQGLLIRYACQVKFQMHIPSSTTTTFRSVH